MVRTFFVAAFLVGLFTLSLLPYGASALPTCPSGVAGAGGATTGICVPADTGLSSASILTILTKLMFWLLTIFGVIAVAAFVISGIQYLTAAGDETQAETAKRNMQYSIIGIIVALSGLIIIQAVSALLSGGSSTF